MTASAKLETPRRCFVASHELFAQSFGRYKTTASQLFMKGKKI
jgi:hypothetical protein